jgi:hypothetical protein
VCFDVTTSICFTHGLGGGARSTWTYREKLSRRRIFWPVELLGSQIPNARIITFGYDTDVGSTRYLTQSVIYQHGRQLLSALVKVREENHATDRPLIFVVHGIGGLLVKSALIFSRQAGFTTDESKQKVFLATAGIVFFGTPQSNLSPKTVRLLLSRVKPRLREDSLREDSFLLERLLDRFNVIAASIPQSSFYETKPVPKVGLVSPQSRLVRGAQLTLVGCSPRCCYCHQDPKTRRHGGPDKPRPSQHDQILQH